MKNIGLGAQDFSVFKKHDYIYVDKTEIIHRLIDGGRYYFLSRPRRFGKSLLVNTIKSLFEGREELFEGTWIYDKWNWEDKYPVIKICFTELSYRNQGLETALEHCLDKLAALHNITYDSPDYSGKFLELIRKLGQEKPVAVLIDEYDKPIIDYLESGVFEKAKENKEILKTLYAGVKDQDKYIRFFFLTGVSKFSRVSIFSDLNHLADISVVDDYAALLGYTREELQKYYEGYLERAAAKLKLSRPALMEKVEEWYDGYSWDGESFVYNPYSVLSFLNFKSFDNFWFETGSPTFLINEIKSSGKKLSASINRKVNKTVFNKYDIDNLNATALMFQTGYLTIKDFDINENKFTLDFPNKEVRESFLNFAVDNYADSSAEEVEHITELLTEALEENDIDSFFGAFQSLFSSITAKQLEKVKDYEGFYHSIIFIVLRIIGIQIECEVQSSFGATDAVVKTNDYIYVFEFKMGSAEDALKQIKKKKYQAPFLADKRTVVMVGFGFDKTERNLVEFIQEKAEK